MKHPPHQNLKCPLFEDDFTLPLSLFIQGKSFSVFLHKGDNMVKYLSRLSNELVKKMNQNNWSIIQLSMICNISYHGMYNIVNEKVSDINLSTFIKICENTHISYVDIFDIDDNELLEREMRKFNLTNGKMKFILQKV